MSQNPDNEKLLGEFPPNTYEEWKTAAVELLKGAPFEKKMLTSTYEGITIQPIYRKEDAANLPHMGQLPGQGGVRGDNPSGYLAKSWEVSQELHFGKPEDFNKVAKHDLGRGQSELNVVLDNGVADGLSLCCLSALEKAFDGIDLAKTSVYLRAGADGLPFAALLLALAKKKGVDPKSLKGCVESDPLAALALAGKLPTTIAAAYDDMAALTEYAEKNGLSLQTVGVQTHPYADGGASAVQELAYALATGADYLKALAERGVSAAVAAKHIRFAFSIGPNFFMEIAKFRAARLLWAQVLEAFGVKDVPMYLHARTGEWNKTTLDPQVNILRGTTEAFAAVVAGVDSLHVSPYDELIRESDEQARRVARNTQVVLGEECELNRVVDPAGGSWAVEWLTDKLAQNAWTLFQEIEALGGFEKALLSGKVQEKVAGIASAKSKDLARRKAVLVGTNQYPNVKEKPLDGTKVLSKGATEGGKKIEAVAAAKGAAKVAAAIEAAATAKTADLFASVSGGSVEAVPVPRARGAAAFEALREAARAYEKKNGSAPTLFQANVGPSRAYRIRADWTSAFFQVGGFAVLNDRDFKDAAEAAAEAIKSPCKVAVITSADDAYAEAVPAIAKAIKAAKPDAYVLVAGAPGDNEAAWKAAGVDDYVNARANTYELLKNLQAKMGVAA
jgi:methylmalonyl-CoA mutase